MSSHSGMEWLIWMLPACARFDRRVRVSRRTVINDFDWKIIAELHATPAITRTAERLNMTQSALSKRLQQIESDLGVQIVVRFSRGIVFTPEGEFLAEKARSVLSNLKDIRQSLLHVGNGKSGKIRIGATNGFARSTLLPFFKEYKQRCPNVEIDVVTDISANLIIMLRDYKIHVGFVCGETELDVERVLVSIDQARAVSKTPIVLDALPKIPQIVYLKDPFSKKLLDAWWRERFVEPPEIGMHANHGDTCREMVLAGLGYAIFLSNAFLSEGTGLFEIPLTYVDGSPLTRNSWMVWQKDFYGILLVRNFIDYMRSSLADGSHSRDPSPPAAACRPRR
jgi:DNA-binding transcriptional LysR family regulator